MRVGVIVDGRAERYALPRLFRRLDATATLVAPVLYADIQSSAPAPRIAKEVAPRVRQMKLCQGITCAVVLIDREDHPQCAPGFARAVEQALNPHPGCPGVPVRVVVKHRTFENWLVSDPDALAAMPKRFDLSAGDRAAIVPNKADHVDGVDILRRSVRGTYEKVRDASQILELLDPLTAALNSRSFRRFLRLIGHPKYASQSVRP